MDNLIQEVNQTIIQEEWLKDLPLQTENLGFQPDEMIACGKCKRKSPPIRLKCMYCGTEIQIDTEHEKFVKPSFRKMESWEKGFNLIYLTQNSVWEDKNIEQAAEALKCEQKDIENIFSSENALPLARLDSLKAAEILHNRLSEIGLICMIVSDEEMKLETVSNRLRGIDLFEDGISLKFFNKASRDLLLWDDIRLIVLGKIFERRKETSENRSRDEERQVTNTVEMNSDELVIDIYDKYSALGYRISVKGFDFSCLGENKKLLAAENMLTLIEILKEKSQYARIDEEYLNLRIHLKNVWDVEQKSDSRGWQRENFGKINRANLVSISNLEQFTRYSRLQWHLLNK